MLLLLSISNLKSETISKTWLIDRKSPEFLTTDLYIKGSDASAHGDYKKAANCFREIVELDPRNNYLNRKLAIELIRGGELHEAEKTLEIALNGSRIKDDDLQLLLASLYVTQAKPELARKIYYKILQTSADIEEACIYIANSFTAEKKYSEAHALLARCENKSNGKPIYAFQRGKIEFERGFKEQAEQFLKKSLKLNHSFEHAALVLGAIYEQKKDFVSAVNTYKDFLAAEGNNKNLSVLSRIVALLFSMKDNTAVIPYAETLDEVNNMDLNLKVRLGLLYSDSGRLEEAISTFKEALIVAPDSENIIYYLGAIYQQMSRNDEAKKFFRRIPPNSSLYQHAKKKLNNL